MNYLEAAQEITELVPDIQNEWNDSPHQNSLTVVRAFTECIKTMIRQNDRKLLFSCLQEMDKMYIHGDTMLKNAIDNTFIYSLDNCTAYCSAEYRKVIFSHISAELQQSYSKQIYSHGI